MHTADVRLYSSRRQHCRALSPSSRHSLPTLHSYAYSTADGIRGWAVSHCRHSNSGKSLTGFIPDGGWPVSHRNGSKSLMGLIQDGYRIRGLAQCGEVALHHSLGSSGAADRVALEHGAYEFCPVTRW